MGDKIKPQFRAGFDLPAEGVYMLVIEEATIEPSQDSERLYRVRSVIEGTEEDGKTVFDNFPHVSRKHFGLRRLLGFLIKIGAIKYEENQEYDIEMFNDPKFAEKFKTIIGRKFGGRIKHVKSEKAKSTEGVMANIVEYYNVKEFSKILEEEAHKSNMKTEKAEKFKPGEQEDWIS